MGRSLAMPKLLAISYETYHIMVIITNFNCQAQPKPQPKLGAELVLISNNPTTHPPTRTNMKQLEFNSDQKTKVA